MSIYVVGHKSPDTDSICSAIGMAYYEKAMGFDAVPARAGEINKETKYALDYFKVDVPELISDAKEVILVDHNEPAQAFDGIENAKILAVIDHHRLGGLCTPDPIYINVRPVGCTATIVADMCWRHEVEIPAEIAGLLLSAILSDTVLFKSPTCTEKDKKAAETLAAIAGVELKEYGMALLKAGAGIDGMTPAQVADTDLKKFEFGSTKAIVSQISVMDPEEVLAIKADLLEAMKANAAAKEVSLALLMVTDILNESTHLLVAGEPADLVEKAFEKKVEDNCVFLPGVMSRKKQIVPQMTNAAK